MSAQETRLRDETDEHVSSLMRKHALMESKFKARDELETTYFPMFKRTDPIFDQRTQVLAIKLTPKIKDVAPQCLLCSQVTPLNSSCCNAPLCDCCIEDCPPDCVHCHQPLAGVSFEYGSRPCLVNPQFEGLKPIVSNMDYGVCPLYPECAFIDLYGVSFPVYCQDKATVDKRLKILNTRQVNLVYFASAGRCPPRYEY